jgi:hypothetical protein
VDAEGNPLTDDALRLAEEADALEAAAAATGSEGEAAAAEEDEIMAEEITDPVKLRKNIDA